MVTNVPESWHAEKVSFKNTSQRQLTADELGLEGRTVLKEAEL